MNTRWKKGIFWGLIVASLIFVMKVFLYFLGGHGEHAGRQHGHGFGPGPGGMGQRGGGFEPHQFMNGSHHSGGFPWLGIIIGLAVLVLLVRWLRRKAKTSSMQQFIDTPLAGSHTAVINQNANILDEWERNLTTKKEND